MIVCMHRYVYLSMYVCSSIHLSCDCVKIKLYFSLLLLVCAHGEQAITTHTFYPGAIKGFGVGATFLCCPARPDVRSSHTLSLLNTVAKEGGVPTGLHCGSNARGFSWCTQTEFASELGESIFLYISEQLTNALVLQGELTDAESDEGSVGRDSKC